MRNVWEELKHNLSGSVLVTLVLIAQFAVFFWQGTLIASYFADTSTESLSLSVQGDYAYYQLDYAIISEEKSAFGGSPPIRILYPMRLKHTGKSMRIRICIIWRLEPPTFL